MTFLRFPSQKLPTVSDYLLLRVGAPPLRQCDAACGLLLLDGTWRYADQMQRALPRGMSERSLGAGWVTAYPRRQTDCSDPQAGLASVEALFAAYFLLGRPTDGLLDNYYWADRFLEQNRDLLVSRAAHDV